MAVACLVTLHITPESSLGDSENTTVVTAWDSDSDREDSSGATRVLRRNLDALAIACLCARETRGILTLVVDDLCVWPGNTVAPTCLLSALRELDAAGWRVAVRVPEGPPSTRCNIPRAYTSSNSAMTGRGPTAAAPQEGLDAVRACFQTVMHCGEGSGKRQMEEALTRAVDVFGRLVGHTATLPDFFASAQRELRSIMLLQRAREEASVSFARVSFGDHEEVEFDKDTPVVSTAGGRMIGPPPTEDLLDLLAAEAETRTDSEAAGARKPTAKKHGRRGKRRRREARG
jgi:hypothetical protein